MSGFLYCLQSKLISQVEPNLYKLGMTKQESVEKRTNSYKTYWPCGILILLKTERIKNVAIAERCLFELLKEFRIEGEYFRCEFDKIEKAFFTICDMEDFEIEIDKNKILNDTIILEDLDPEVGIITKENEDLLNKSIDNACKNLNKITTYDSVLEKFNNLQLEEDLVSNIENIDSSFISFDNDIFTKNDQIPNEISTFMQEIIKNKKIGDDLEFHIKDSDVAKYLGIELRTLRKRLNNTYSQQKVYYEGADYLKISSGAGSTKTYMLNYQCFERIAMGSDSMKSEIVRKSLTKLREFIHDNHRQIYKVMNDVENLNKFTGKGIN